MGAWISSSKVQMKKSIFYKQTPPELKNHLMKEVET
jgi:hypothetical protein